MFVSGAGLPTATEDESESTEAEEGGGGGFGDNRGSGVLVGVASVQAVFKTPFPCEVAFYCFAL